jgi:peptide/nickel transport system permease protein
MSEPRAAERFSRLRLALSVAAARPRFVVGYAIVLVVVMLAVFAPIIAPYDPIEADPVNFLHPPEPAHWFGTDAVGMDILSRTLYAPRIDLTIAVIGTVISGLIGSIIGAWVGFFSQGGGLRSALSYLVMRVADVLQAFPVFVLAIGLVSSLGQSIQTVIVAIAFVNIPIYLRLMRSQVMSLRDMRFVEAAIVARLPTWKLMVRHIIPNAMGSGLAQLSVNIGWSILLTAGLSFVGAGVRPPAPEWGSMIAGGFQNVVTGQWWPSVVPGLALGTTVFAFSLIGSSLETFFDPIKMRRLVREASRERTGRAAEMK